jgi:hypothetical protein
MAPERVPCWKLAEKRVSEELSKLLVDGYLILNDVKYRYGNIDHVAIRPDGTIFLIETKSHKGIVSSDDRRVLVNGQPLKANPISQIMRSIRWVKALAKRLTGKNSWIVAVLVFPNAEVRIRGSTKRVNVIEAGQLRRFLRDYRRS